MSNIEQVHACIDGMFNAQINGDVDGALSFMADSHCIWNVRAGDLSDPTIWKAGGYATRIELKEWLSKQQSYNVQYKYLHTDIWEAPDKSRRTAIAVVEETGKAVFHDGNIREWTEVVNLWSVAEIDGTWKVTGSMHHVGESA